MAASGGGHVRQILDLEPLWSKNRYFFVTEDTALGKYISARHDTTFLPHFALGQARQGKLAGMATTALKSFFRCARILLHRRPDVVLTTGAGAMFFIAVWGRLLGAKIILIDSFARFDKPSTFARITGLLAHVRITQSAKSGALWPGAHVFDPFKCIDTPRPAKEQLVFATVGATLPFKRMVKLVADAKADGLIPEHLVVQAGKNASESHAMLAGLPDTETTETLPFEEVTDLLKRADIVICHGGTGSIITALREGCRIITVPRQFELGEHYDEHQSEITTAFAERGLLLKADTPEEFAMALKTVRERQPISATTDPAEMIAFLQDYLDKNFQ
ncbi:MAG: glycosyltransferase [Sphingobium sp.]